MSATFTRNANTYFCQGNWSVLHLDKMLPHIHQHLWPSSESVIISGEKLQILDSAGALLLKQCVDNLKEKGNKVTLSDFSKVQLDMLELIEKNQDALDFSIPTPRSENIFSQIGRETEEKVKQFDGLVILIGELSSKLFSAMGKWKKLQFPSIVSNIYSAGLQALPIVGLLAFLIGVVLAYQMGLQLQTYGANSFIAYLSGMAIFREFGPLITAIIVAGRTSSAFTAQIGSMKINEEIDAILTMGLSPIELLVLPKMIGLVLVFPLLIFWSDFFSVVGAIIMSKGMLGILPHEFLSNLKESVGLKQMMLGLYKAPVFAVLIALVGCFQGFRVKASADSVGHQTTKSVVQALFLIIVADAAFSVTYSWMGI